MPISNYVTPGVYVTQSPVSPFASANSEALNICFIGSSTIVPSGSQVDYFTSTSISGGQTFYLSYLTTSGNISSVKTTNAAVTLSGTDYIVGSAANSQGNTVTTLQLRNTASVSGVVNSQLAVGYSYSSAVSGQFYTFNDYNTVAATFGNPWNYTASGVAIQSPVSLAALLAFQNGAQSVTCVNITTSGAAPTESDYLNAITAVSGNSVFSNPQIDVIVPLTNVTTTGVLLPFLTSFLTTQAQNGVYQRAFVGFDSLSGIIGASASSLDNVVAGLASTANSTRVSVVAPQLISLNPGLNSVTGYSNGVLNVGGYYLAAALAGTFVGQPDVYVPITQKTVNGFVGIPNQVSPNDSQTIQSLGGTIVRQRNNGVIYVRHGLTTNVTNWLTQELSINAIGDRLAQNIQGAIENSSIIGSALTQNTLSSLQSIVLATLMRSVNTNLIQSFQNLSYSYSNTSPTTVNVSFQYSPTFPLNYVQITMSVNSQSGLITTASNVNSTALG